ncbi:hypothetical protein [Stratiformator vulcanicus]|nr:hypothetical protein [Stratiformator vulcanicus]
MTDPLVNEMNLPYRSTPGVLFLCAAAAFVVVLPGCGAVRAVLARHSDRGFESPAADQTFFVDSDIHAEHQPIQTALATSEYAGESALPSFNSDHSTVASFEVVTKTEDAASPAYDWSNWLRRITHSSGSDEAVPKKSIPLPRTDGSSNGIGGLGGGLSSFRSLFSTEDVESSTPPEFTEGNDSNESSSSFIDASSNAESEEFGKF